MIRKYLTCLTLTLFATTPLHGADREHEQLMADLRMLQEQTSQLHHLIAALEADFDTGFNKLMEYDQLSVRQYLLNRNFTGPEIEWIETINDATGHYDDMSLSQAALEQWIFDSAPLSSWQAVDGGMDRMTYGMTKILKNSVITSKRVTAIRPGAGTSLDVVINGTEVRNYAHVINTVPLGVMQTTTPGPTQPLILATLLVLFRHTYTTEPSLMSCLGGGLDLAREARCIASESACLNNARCAASRIWHVLWNSVLGSNATAMRSIGSSDSKQPGRRMDEPNTR